MQEFINTPFNYTGSKFKILSEILPKFDYTKSTFVDLFCGGGSVYTNVVDKYDKLICNDIIGDLMMIHQRLIEGDDIIHETKALCVEKKDKESFYALRDSYNNEPTPEKLWALTICCFQCMLRFNLKFKFNQAFGERSWNKRLVEKTTKFTEHIRKHRDQLHFMSTHFSQVPICKDTMVYCDPPYSNSAAGYNCYWSADDDTRLYEYCLAIDKAGGSFAVSGCLSHDGQSCKLLDALVEDGYNVHYINIHYDRVSKSGPKKTREVLITNY